MTKVTVNSGACGFTVVITAEKGRERKVALSADTACEMVRAMAAELSVLDMMAVFSGHLSNPVYKAAAKHLKHVACPVPAAFLKALEVEAGLNLPRDVTIVFEKGDP